MKGIILGILGSAGVGKDTAADYLVRTHRFAKLSLADELKRFSKNVFSFTDEQLWGPSELRNEPVKRFKTEAAWTDVIWKLAQYSPEWCRRLFYDPAQASQALFTWVYNLHKSYGPNPDSASEPALSPRIVLQTLGTEFGRGVEPQVWVRACMNTAHAILSGVSYSREAGLLGSRLSAEDQRQLARYLDLNDPRLPAGVVIPDVRFRNEISGVKDDAGLVIRLYRQTQVDPLNIGIVRHTSETEQQSIPDTAVDYVLHVENGLPAFYAQLDALIERINQEHP